MDIYNALSSGDAAFGFGELSVIRTVDMHTSGEPTRIVVSGYPELHGWTLLEKRAYAKEKIDHLRTRLMWEPRGHRDMYGAILVRETELTASGEADIGVLFMHNEGYSTMCGHATIALGRFLVDTQDRAIFPRRGQLAYDAEKGETELRLHAPCGVVRVTVPTIIGAGGTPRSDGGRRVKFVSVPSFVCARDVEVQIPEEQRWATLRAAGRASVRVDVAYGGAFYVIVGAQELGFTRGLGGGYALSELDTATRVLKAQVAGRGELFKHPTERALEYAYGVIVTDDVVSVCFFADQQVDRSPTGSGVCARVALAVAAGRMAVGDGAEFESLVSVRDGARASAFRGTAIAVETLAGPGGRGWNAVRVAVEGRAGYTGGHAFVAEDRDAVSRDGFLLDQAA